MKKIHINALIIVISIIFIFLYAETAEAESMYKIKISELEKYTYAEEVFNIINKVRENNGKDVLIMDEELTRVAMQRAVEIALFYGHNRPNGGEWYSVEDEYGVYVNAENIAMGQSTPNIVMQDLLNSIGHKNNILNSNYKSVGIGCVIANKTLCWVQLFSTQKFCNYEKKVDANNVFEIEIPQNQISKFKVSEEKINLITGNSKQIFLTAQVFNKDYVITPYLIDLKIYDKEDENKLIATAEVLEDGYINITAVDGGQGILKIYGAMNNQLQLNVDINVENANDKPIVDDKNESDINTQKTSITYINKESDGSYSVIVSIEGNKELREIEIPVKIGNTNGIAIVEIKYDGIIRRNIAVYRDGKVYFKLERSGTLKIINDVRPFSDVPEYSDINDHWAKLSIEKTVELGLFKGKSDLRFEPDGKMTREQMWMVLSRAIGEGQTTMNDARAFLIGKGITDGSNSKGNVTREQFVTLLWRTLGSPKSTYSLAQYNDYNDISNYAKESFAWAVEIGLINGITPNLLNPRGFATRAQVARIFERLF